MTQSQLIDVARSLVDHLAPRTTGCSTTGAAPWPFAPVPEPSISTPETCVGVVMTQLLVIRLWRGGNGDPVRSGALLRQRRQGGVRTP